MKPSAHEDLALIRQIMEETRREVVDRGRHFTIWGTISTVGLIATYAAVTGGLAVDPGWVWAALLALGWAASFYVGWRDGRKARVRTLGRRLLDVTWVSVALTLTLVGVAGLFGEVLGERALAGVLSAVIAAPILVTSELAGERWLRWVAGGWWIGGGVMLFVPGPYALLLMAAMSLLLLALPGAVLNARSRRERTSSGVIDAA